MAQEFTINSSAIESKINSLLPSQGGFGAGVDFSASTMVIPIVDLTETAEGGDARQDLQSALSFTSSTVHFIQNATNTVIINTTGYYRVFGRASTAGSGSCSFNLFDGTTSKQIIAYGAQGGTEEQTVLYDFIVFLQAGESLRGTTNSTSGRLAGVTRQLADITGTLVNP
jgi:hypothetical protein